jgi:hypothetical protein
MAKMAKFFRRQYIRTSKTLAAFASAGEQDPVSDRVALLALAFIS